jgi:hypothetical protein
MTDPWAAASVATAPQPGQGQQPADAGQGQGSALAGAFASGQGGTALFQQGGIAPSLFNKTHFLGTERKGKIVKAPYEQQSRDFNNKLPKYWSLSKVGGERKDRAVTTDAVDAPTGKPNRPVMDVMVELETEYGPLSQQECLAIPREWPSQAGDSKRVFAVSGKDALDKFRKAIADFNAANPGALKSEEDLVGKFLTVKRVGQSPNAGGQPSWVVEIKLSSD